MNLGRAFSDISDKLYEMKLFDAIEK